MKKILLGLYLMGACAGSFAATEDAPQIDNKVNQVQAAAKQADSKGNEGQVATDAQQADTQGNQDHKLTNNKQVKSREVGSDITALEHIGDTIYSDPAITSYEHIGDTIYGIKGK